MDDQGVGGCFLFPTLGVGMEEALAHDPEALVAAFHAFNLWLDEDRGYAYKERIFAAPMITLVDVDAAVAELDEVLARDARIVCIKGGPAHTPFGPHLSRQRPLRPVLGQDQRSRGDRGHPLG